MRKKLFVLVSLLLAMSLPACGADEAAQQEKQEYHIMSVYVRRSTGDVSVTEYSYDEDWMPVYTETRLNGDFASAVEYNYSEDKTRLTMNYSSAVYEPHSTQQELSYDEQGRLIKAAMLENGEISVVSEYFYDEMGREIKVLSTTPGGYETVIERSYDKKGNLRSYIADTGLSQSRQEYSYDAQNRVTSVSYYQNDKLESVSDYSYEDNVRYGTVCDEEGKLHSKLMEVLDEAGNVLESERCDATGAVQSYICTVYIGTDGSVSGELPK